MRDNRIDILRFIGLAMIIFAHTNPPALLFQIRNFDVPLMILVSGMSFSLSYKPVESFQYYVWKRFKRLVFPVWLFLTIYFLGLYAIFPNDSQLQAYKILTSFLLIDGIGYVWIIRVFLLVALVSPFISYFSKNIKLDLNYFLILFFAFALYEVLLYLSFPYIQKGVGRALSLIAYYIVPYSLVFAMGLRMPSLEPRKLYSLAFISFFIFMVMGTILFLKYGRVIVTQQLKYPPSLYYFSYAIFVSTLLWLCSSHMESLINKLFLKKLVLFIAQNSIWIYLWHIPLIKFISATFMTKYLLVFGFSTLITLCQVWFVTNVLLKNLGAIKSKQTLKYCLQVDV